MGARKAETELCILLKMELQDILRNVIRSLVRQSNLKVNDDMVKYVKAEMSPNKVKLVSMNQVTKVDLKK